mgnify:CR=1 FL=1
MEILLIVAMARNRVIGRNNTIPWHLPEEMQFFKETTMGHGVLMGRKTFESIGKPLPGRLNIILSRNKKFHAPGGRTATSLEEGIACCRGQEKVFIIGGERIFQDSLALVDTILLSLLDEEYEGDTYFPTIPSEIFEQVEEKRMGRQHPFTLLVYRRRGRE